MNAKKIKYFENMLLDAQEKNLGIADLLVDSSSSVTLDQTKVGRLSRMDAMQQQAMSQASDGRREENLVQIKEALERIQDGIFGECLKCLEPIAEARLEIDPSISLCIKCAELAS